MSKKIKIETLSVPCFGIDRQSSIQHLNQVILDYNTQYDYDDATGMVEILKTSNQ